MHIGLIGGIGPAATDFYYRRLIANFAARRTPLDLTIVHADAPTLIGHLADDNKAAQVEIYSKLADRLVAAGAGCVVVTSIGGHFCIEPFEEISPLPVINMLTEVKKAVRAQGLKRIGILGTSTVMTSHFYGGLGDVEVLVPQGDMLEHVHTAYVTMAAAGVVTDTQRKIFDDACRQFMDNDQADAVMLGGTDLALVYDADRTAFPIVDCAAIHADAVTEFATR